MSFFIFNKKACSTLMACGTCLYNKIISTTSICTERKLPYSCKTISGNQTGSRSISKNGSVAFI